MITNSGQTFASAPTGAHTAILTKIIDLGTQESEYLGEKTVRAQQLWTWELPYELMDDGQPFIISKFYTKSLGEKANLTKDLTSWLGKTPTVPFDEKTLLGKACQVIVTGRENSDKVKISAIAPLAKGTQVPKQPHNELVYFSLDNFDQDAFDNLSAGIKNMITKSPEYLKAVGSEIDVEQEEDDIEPAF